MSTRAERQPIGEAVGKTIPRLDGMDKATGRAIYTDDMTLPGMLHAAVLGSQYAHANIVSYDIGAAEQLDGVKAVLTGEYFKNPYGPIIQDEYPLARGKVRYVGEPVVAVAAVDLATARAALQLIDVEYEELPAVFDAEEAMQDDAPELHDIENLQGLAPKTGVRNAATCSVFQEGEPDTAWDQCDVIVEGVFETPAQEHMYLETCSTLVDVDSNGKLTIWSSVQSVHLVQSLTASALGLPMSKVRVIAAKVGGAFGGKNPASNQPIAGALALAAGAPVKLTFSREDDMMMNKSRHASRIYMRTGAKADGTLVAREVRGYFNTGAYADEGPFVAQTGAFFARGPYRIPHIRARAWCVYTNRVKAGPFRGFGVPQITFPAEQQLDEIAQQLNMDPIDLRELNAMESGEHWLGGGPVDKASLKDCLRAVREASGWDERRNHLPQVPGKRRGLGVVGMAHISGLLSSAANISLNQDGTATVNTGSVDIGEGADTALCQIAAGALGLSLDQVNYAPIDSDHSPFNYATAGSRTTYTMGVAVEESGQRVKEQIIKHAAEMMECSEQDLELRPGGWVGMKGMPDAQLPFAAVAGRSLFGTGGPIIGTHSWLFQDEGFDPKRTLMDGFSNTNPPGAFAFAAQIIEVEVDEVTGQVTVLEAWSAHDVGRAINPGSVEGQIHGGLVQGIGYSLVEELVWDDGRMANPTMMDYKVPGAADVPVKIHPIILENRESTGPFGARGLGEIPISGPGPAICNAIYHATGVRLRTIPATPERVLTALRESTD